MYTMYMSVYRIEGKIREAEILQSNTSSRKLVPVKISSTKNFSVELLDSRLEDIVFGFLKSSSARKWS